MSNCIRASRTVFFVLVYCADTSPHLFLSPLPPNEQKEIEKNRTDYRSTMPPPRIPAAVLERGQPFTVYITNFTFTQPASIKQDIITNILGGCSYSDIRHSTDKDTGLVSYTPAKIMTESEPGLIMDRINLAEAYWKGLFDISITAVQPPLSFCYPVDCYHLHVVMSVSLHFLSLALVTARL